MPQSKLHESPRFHCRRATKADCLDIARLYQISSDGVADYIWSILANPGEALLEVGARRYGREGVNFSYQNCFIVEDCRSVNSDSQPIAGMLQAFPMHIDPAYVEEDEILRPYSELEQNNSYYVSGVAVYPEFRNNKIGWRLMQRAETFARIEGLNSVSLIVFEQNAGAKRLYERLGYQVISSREIVPHPLIHYTGEALLMVKTMKNEGWIAEPLELNYPGPLVDSDGSHETI